MSRFDRWLVDPKGVTSQFLYGDIHWSIRYQSRIRNSIMKYGKKTWWYFLESGSGTLPDDPSEMRLPLVLKDRA